jgi:hypothetical protein
VPQEKYIVKAFSPMAFGGFPAQVFTISRLFRFTSFLVDSLLHFAAGANLFNEPMDMPYNMGAPDANLFNESMVTPYSDAMDNWPNQTSFIPLLSGTTEQE